MIKFILSIPYKWRIIIFIGYLLVVAVLSLMPSDNIPNIPLFPGADKLIHASLYVGLSFLSCWSFPYHHQKYFLLWMVLFTAFWGIMMEVLQLIMHAGRSFELFDQLANTTGAVLGAVLYWGLVHVTKN